MKHIKKFNENTEVAKWEVLSAKRSDDVIFNSYDNIKI